MNEKKPIMADDRWICPECGWQNPISNMILMSNPPGKRYLCHGCDYIHYAFAKRIPSDVFRSRFPGGKPPVRGLRKTARNE